MSPQNSLGESRYPKGSLEAHIRRPVPGCLTTSRFLLLGATGQCQKPSRISYLAKKDDGLTEGAASHTLGKLNGAVATNWFVPTE